MEKLFNSKKIDAAEFFSAKRIQPENYSSLIDDKFADNLGEKLASLHLNISQKKSMGTSKFPIFKSLLLAGGGFSLGLLLILGIVFRTQLFPTTHKSISGELAFSEGTVEYKNLNSGWFNAKANQKIDSGSSVRVLGNGKAIINLDDGSVVRLDNDSQVTFKDLNPKEIQLANDKGSVYTRVAKLDRTFEVLVGEDIYRSLGTAYKTINLDTKKGVRVYESTVEVIVKDKDGNIKVEQGKKFFTLDESNKDNVEKVLPMTKEEISKDSFTKWNADQDKSIEEYKNKLGVLETGSAPKLEITSPLSVDTKEDKVTVTGKTDPGAKIKTNYGFQDVNENGEFSFEITVPDGESEIIVKAVAENGQITEKRISVNKNVEEPTSTPKPTPTQTANKSISLSSTGNGNFKWSVNGYFANGFKLVWSKNTNPTYPNRSGDYYNYYSDPSARTGNISDKDGVGTYYVRVCEYLGGACGVYSNQVSFTYSGTPTTTQKVNSLTLKSTGNGNFSWTVNGYSVNGFKLVWSKNTNPTYPTRSGDSYAYYSSPSTTSGSIDATEAGTYYVRVCEYLGGSCGVYSNQVTYTVSGSTAIPTQKVTSISLSNNGGGNVSWNVNGYSELGYKVVWSQNQSPTYPTRDGDQYIYLSNPDEKSSTVTPFSGSGTYYVRVCEYLGGACGVYSNQISVSL